MKAISMFRTGLRARLSAANLMMDCRGMAAVEFAIIVPVMLVIFFGVIDIASGVAVDRKVTLVARTLTDLTGQSIPDAGQNAAPVNKNTATIYDNDLLNSFNASAAIMQPYLPTPETATLSEIYIDSTGKKATVTWTKAATFGSDGKAVFATSSHAPKDDITALPVFQQSLLAAPSTYVILSEVGYVYKPVIGYSMGSVTLKDVAYTRPRQVQCVVYNASGQYQPGPDLSVDPSPTPIPANTPCPTP